MPTIRFLKQFEEAVRSGQKTSTVRRGKARVQKGEVELAFGDSCLRARVTEIRETTFSQLNDDDAQKDGFSNVQQLHAVLLNIYPEIGPSDTVSIITFQTVEDG